MTKQVKKTAIVLRQNIGLLVFKTQSMKTSLNSYAVLLKIDLALIFFVTENKAKLILKHRYVYICIFSAFVCSSSVETILYYRT